MKCGVWSVLLCLCLSVSMSVSMSVSVCEGGCSWLREVTRRHGSNVLPFSGPSVGYCISLPGSLGNGRFGPNPSRGGHGSKFLPFGGPSFWAKSWPGGHGRLREVTGGYGGGKRRKVEERQEKGRRKPQKMTEMSSVTE